MPSVSKKQHNLMAAVAKNPAFAKKVGIKQSVGEEFLKADKGRKFGSGGKAKLQEVNKPKTNHGGMNLFKEGGMPKKEMMHSEKGEMKADIKQDKAIVKKAFSMHDKQLHEKKKTDLSKLKSGGRIASKGEHAIQKQSKRGAMEVKMAKGGLAAGHKSADGCVTKGKTKARAVAMCGGGYMKGKK
jgi:hypothetical protein